MSLKTFALDQHGQETAILAQSILIKWPDGRTVEIDLSVSLHGIPGVPVYAGRIPPLVDTGANDAMPAESEYRPFSVLQVWPSASNLVTLYPIQENELP
jgi:hypothetical protein